jgi:hypothetical protein
MTLPTLDLKTKAIISVVAIATAFASGRYSVNQPPAVKLVETSKTQVEQRADKDIHETTKTETVKEPDGEVKTTVVETKDTVSKVDTEKQVDMSVQLTQTPAKRSTINISALVALDALHGFTPCYGVSASKEFIGPITVGAFGLTNGTLGVSVGVNF